MFIVQHNQARFGLLVPGPLRDAAYQIVADHRYRWFGTQPLDNNFAKQLCPYYYFKEKQEARAAAKAEGGITQANPAQVAAEQAAVRGRPLQLRCV